MIPRYLIRSLWTDISAAHGLLVALKVSFSVIGQAGQTRTGTSLLFHFFPLEGVFPTFSVIYIPVKHDTPDAILFSFTWKIYVAEMGWKEYCCPDGMIHSQTIGHIVTILICYFVVFRRSSVFKRAACLR